MIRAGALSRIRGSSNRVNRNDARWFTQKTVSIPFSVRVRLVLCIPALLINTSMRGYFSRMVAAVFPTSQAGKNPPARHRFAVFTFQLVLNPGSFFSVSAHQHQVRTTLGQPFCGLISNARGRSGEHAHAPIHAGGRGLLEHSAVGNEDEFIRPFH